MKHTPDQFAKELEDLLIKYRATMDTCREDGTFIWARVRIRFENSKVFLGFQGCEFRDPFCSFANYRVEVLPEELNPEVVKWKKKIGRLQFLLCKTDEPDFYSFGVSGEWKRKTLTLWFWCWYFEIKWTRKQIKRSFMVPDFEKW